MHEQITSKQNSIGEWEMETSQNEIKVPLELSKKLLLVMKALNDIPKTGQNEKEDYAYIEDKVLTPLFRKALIDQELVVLQNVIGSEKVGQLTKVKVRFTFVDTKTGECWSCNGEGEGDGAGDKGIYKAMTGCRKYFILTNFNLSSKDDPEQTKTNAPSQQQNQAPTQQGRQNASKPQGQGRSFPLTKKQVSRLFAIGFKAKWESEEINQYIKAAWGHAEPDSMKKNQYDFICGLMPKLDFKTAMEKLRAQKR